jgi:hypothetical protein
MYNNCVDYIQDGKLLAEKHIIGSSKGLFGSAQEYQIKLSVKIGSLTDFNIWNRSLSYKEMVDWTTCK